MIQDKIELDSAVLRSRTCKHVINILNKVYKTMNELDSNENNYYKKEVDNINEQKKQSSFMHQSIRNSYRRNKQYVERNGK